MGSQHPAEQLEVTLLNRLSPGRSAVLPAALLLAGALVQILYGYAHVDQYGQAWGQDDAYISYRYAQNLVEGHGLVYNPGDRVEGYSNFLYVLLMVPAFLFTTGMGVYAWAATLNTICALAALYLWHGAARHKHGPDAAAIGSLLLALCPPIWAAVSSGMEPALVLLLTVAVWRLLPEALEEHSRPRFILLSLVLTAAMLLRADGLLLTAMAVAFALMRRRWRSAATLLAIMTICTGVYLSWRFSYYGSILPNTYYVKISGPVGERIGHAAGQILGFAISGALLPYLLVLLTVLSDLFRKIWKTGAAALQDLSFETICCAGVISYWFYIGGDQLGDRFLIALFPMGIALLASTVLAGLKSRVKGYVVLLLLALHLVPLASDPRFQYTPSKYDMWITLGEYMGEWEQGATIGVHAAGKIPFFSGLMTLDMLGLNEPHLARKEVDFFLPGHNKYDADYSLSRNPDFIAAFIDPVDLDMYYGLWRGRYEEAGYHVHYLVSGKEDLGVANVVDVRSLHKEEIKRMVRDGYFFGVLSRIGPDSASGDLHGGPAVSRVGPEAQP